MSQWLHAELSHFISQIKMALGILFYCQDQVFNTVNVKEELILDIWMHSVLIISSEKRSIMIFWITLSVKCRNSHFFEWPLTSKIGEFSAKIFSQFLLLSLHLDNIDQNFFLDWTKKCKMTSFLSFDKSFLRGSWVSEIKEIAKSHSLFRKDFA